MYAGEERRLNPLLTLAEVEAHIDRHIDLKLSNMLDRHTQEERDDREAIKDELIKLQNLITSAFPAGDIDGHRRYHEESIETMRDLRNMLKGVRDSTVTGVVWAVIVFVSLAIWSAIKSKVGTP